MKLCLENDPIDTTDIFIDGTHLKAATNNRKYTTEVIETKSKFMSEDLEKEINIDRAKHQKKPLKEEKSKKLDK